MGQKPSSAFNPSLNLNIFFHKMGLLVPPPRRRRTSSKRPTTPPASGCAGVPAREPARDHVGRRRPRRNAGGAARGPPEPLPRGRRRKWGRQHADLAVCRSAGVLSGRCFGIWLLGFSFGIFSTSSTFLTLVCCHGIYDFRQWLITSMELGWSS
ncbi:hypothetical protein QTO34_010274 [Cnephaeus nilssonii]|uniref:Uncharacterized protein n=1 Tax=Cnephaeus nilssonii TaxID=3371016 RepID=A0AA40LFV7_CNENI|nr:hypothetical protein QTO34_010274 [Eptesicus nilssonii]